MSITHLEHDKCTAILARIVSEFGKGRIEENRYIFDQITHLPTGFREMRLANSELSSHLKRYPELLVIFDPHTGNKPYRLNLLHSLGIDEDHSGLRIDQSALQHLLENKDCDFYLTTLEGLLLAVVCHEDEDRGNGLLRWCRVKAS